jgi:serine/threonine protein kinase
MAQCASQEALLKLLADELPQEEAGLSEHVDKCARCRQALDELSDDTELRLWARASLQAPFDAPQDDPVLVELVGRLHEAGQPSLSGPPPDTSHSTIFREGIRQGEELKVLRLIGRGGMGEVYEAHQPSLDRSVAIKLLPHWLADDPEALERFRREAAVTARLDHPNIVPIYAFGQWGDRWYYTMKLVRGVSLAELIRWRNKGRTTPRAETRTMADDTTGTGDLPTTQFAELPGVDLTPAIRESLRPICEDYARDPCEFTRRVGRQAARALAYAHQHDQIHRDIKPSNIMIDGHSQVYLIDFGLTRGISQTITHHRAGTLRYMSPEQLDLRELDGRTDIFSLGVTLYELASGENPFGHNEESLADRIRAADTTPLLVAVPQAPRDLARAIERCIERDREKRFSDAGTLADSLLATSPGDETVAVAKTRILRPRLPGRLRGRLLLATSLLCTAALCIWLAFPVVKALRAPARTDSGSSTVPAREYWTWINTFALEPPSRLLGSDRRRQTQWTADPAKRRISVHGPGLLMIRLGETDAADYSIQIGMFQEEWLGSAGVFFGYQEIPGPDGSSTPRFQEIVLNRRPNLASQEPFWLEWSYVDNFRSRELERWPISVEDPREHALELLVRGGTLVEVAWDRHVVFTKEVPEQPYSRDYIGAFGIKYVGHRTEIRNPRVMFYPKEIQ